MSRHLTVAQRAAIAVEALPLFEAEAKERMLAGVRPTLPSPDGRVGSRRPSAAHRVARQFGISGATVERAKRVQRADPEAFARQAAGL